MERVLNKAMPGRTAIAIACNLVITFEMEAFFLTNPQQWSVITDKFWISTKGDRECTVQEVIDSGTHNLFLEDSEHYFAWDETFKSSYELFRHAFSNGFHWVETV